MAWWNRKAKAGTAEQELIAKLQEVETVLNSVPDNWRARAAMGISGGYDFSDTLHNVYLDYGYPESVTFFQFWNMYRRFGIAKNVVDLPVDVGWMTDPVVKSETERFNAEFEALNKEVKFLSRVKGLDKRQRVGRYAGMFMRVKDGKTPDQPLSKLNGVASLMAMVPMYEGQLRVLTTESDPREENYSLPTMYQFVGSGTGARNENAADSFNIHPDRVVIASEGADNGGIYGVPALEASYNSLMDLRKIIGAGGEGFYKNAAQSLYFNVKEASSGKVDTSLLEKFNDQVDEFMRDRMRRSLWGPGMDAKTLESDLASPEHHFKNALNDVSAGSIPMIPATILVGQQTGRLASDEDSRSFLSTLNSRNNEFVTDMLRDNIDWCIKWGVLMAAEYAVTWQDLLALSDQEKLANALKMAENNAKQFDAGGTMIFTSAEIREAGGFDEESEDGFTVNEHKKSETRLNNARSIQALADAGQKMSMGGEEIIGDQFFDQAEELMGLDLKKSVEQIEEEDDLGVGDDE